MNETPDAVTMQAQVRDVAAELRRLTTEHQRATARLKAALRAHGASYDSTLLISWDEHEKWPVARHEAWARKQTRLTLDEMNDAKADEMSLRHAMDAEKSALTALQSALKAEVELSR